MNATLTKFNGREVWENHRETGVGGSDAPVIMGVAGDDRSIMQLFMEKRGFRQSTSKQREKLFQRGHRMEQWIAEDYAQETGREVEDLGFHSFRSLDVPWMLCTIDRQINPGVEGFNGPGILEAKSAFGLSRRVLLEDTPEKFLVQVQHEMAVTGWEWSSVAATNPVSGMFTGYVDVRRNDDFIKMLMEEEARFMWYVQKNELPPPDFTQDCTRAMNLLWPKDNGETIPLPEKLLETDQRLEKVKAELKELKKEETLLKNTIIKEIGAASLGILPDGTRYSYKHIHADAYAVAEKEYRALYRKKPPKGKE